MDKVFSFIVIAVLLVIFYLLRANANKRSRAERPKPDRADSQGPDTTYHAVSIVYAANACKAARDMEGRRFLSGVAPKLPLDRCDVTACKCRFAHHNDRRRGTDRRNPYVSQFGGNETGSHKQEKRSNRDRRAKPPDAF